MAEVGLAPREVRLVIVFVGLVAAGILTADNGSSAPLGILILEAALGLLAILATITAIQRTIHVVRQASKETKTS